MPGRIVKLTPTETAAMPCDLCGAPAFTPEQQLDGELLDMAADDHADGAGTICQGCSDVLVNALANAPSMTLRVKMKKPKKRGARVAKGSK